MCVYQLFLCTNTCTSTYVFTRTYDTSAYHLIVIPQIIHTEYICMYVYRQSEFFLLIIGRTLGE